ncbi:Transposon TX1 putative 149 kDa protein, partial [Glycine soja]
GVWCFLGDFNSIRSQQERLSSSQSVPDHMGISDFNQWIQDMEIQEVKSAGSTFTWIRPNGSVKSRLDRFLVSDQWLSTWPDSCQHVLPRDLSDHCPTILQTKMVDWEKWLKQGDCNSAYFHKAINFRRNYNSMQGILIGDVWVQDPIVVKNEAVSFFQNRFSEMHKFRPTLDGVQFPSINQRQRDILSAPFSDQEIKEAVWSCGGEKCPGPDGFNFNFLKEFWEVVKADFSRFVNEFHVHGCFPRGSNASFLALIPKIHHPQSFDDYRPISLIGCMYKVIAKNFLWGGDMEHKKIPWVKWEEVCLPKAEGGLGIKDIATFNEALLGKWIWALASDQQQLW